MMDTLAKPLTDAEIAELDELLLAVPDDRDPLDVSMLDGYLTGILVQPDAVMPSAWLPRVFGAQEGEIALAGAADTARACDLVMRRYNELAAALAAREPIDPIVYTLDDEHGVAATGTAAIKALWPWAAGFMHALGAFPALLNEFGEDPEVELALTGILRHTPVDPDDTTEIARYIADVRARLDQDMPLPNLDAALEDVALCVLEIADITRPREPVRRAAPKVGRNDPCPCGSGRKYKQCHGRSAH